MGACGTLSTFSAMAAERKSLCVYVLCTRACVCVCVSKSAFKVLCVISGMKHHCCNNGIKAALMKEAIKWYLISSASNTKKHFHILKFFLLLFSGGICRFPTDIADWRTAKPFLHLIG